MDVSIPGLACVNFNHLCIHETCIRQTDAYTYSTKVPTSRYSITLAYVLVEFKLLVSTPFTMLSRYIVYLSTSVHALIHTSLLYYT